MTKRRHRHDIRKGRDALAYGRAEGFGPMLNARHPRKLKLEPLVKKETAPSGADAERGDRKSPVFT